MRKSKRAVWVLRLLCLVLLAGLCREALPLRAEAAGNKQPVACGIWYNGQFSFLGAGIPIGENGDYSILTPASLYQGSGYDYAFVIDNYVYIMTPNGSQGDYYEFTASLEGADSFFYQTTKRPVVGKGYTLLGYSANGEFIRRNVVIRKASNKSDTSGYQIYLDQEIAGMAALAAIVDESNDLIAIAGSKGVYALKAPSSGNTVLYIGIGVAVVLVLLFLLKKRNSTPGQNTTNSTSGQSVQGNASGVPDHLTDSNAARPPRLPKQEGVRLTLDLVSGPMAGQSYPISEIPLLVGRANEANIRYPADTKGVSRNHCRVFWKNGVLYIMDLGSTSGTFLRGKGKLQPSAPVPLKAQDTIYLGSKQVALQLKARS